MVRVLKKTRAKYLPPTEQLNVRDSDVPNTNLFYDDNKTLFFLSGAISMPSGLPANHQLVVPGGELSSSLYASGSVRKGVADTFVSFSQDQRIQPFRDCDNYGCDNKGNIFFATGSATDVVGEGFDQPLWSKEKLEIDLTPSNYCHFQVNNGAGATTGNYPMAYWSPVNKTWQGIGNGASFSNYYVDSLEAGYSLLEQQCIGFTDGLDNSGLTLDQYGASKGTMCTNFGFPYHAKFHATSSLTTKMGGLISQPFLVEKMVLHLSATLALNTYHFKSTCNYTLTNFFVLAQRRPFYIQRPCSQGMQFVVAAGATTNFVTSAFVPSTYNGVRADTIRDVVGTFGIVSYVSPLGDATFLRDYNNPGIEYSCDMVVSSSAKSPQPSDNTSYYYWYKNRYVVTHNTNTGSRCGIFIADGRSFKSNIQYATIVSTHTSADLITYKHSPSYQKVNPYLLMPQDELVIGCQLPLYSFLTYDDTGTNLIYNKLGAELSFPAGVTAKLVLYGSYLKGNKEIMDTGILQVSSSNFVRTVIG